MRTPIYRQDVLNAGTLRATKEEFASILEHQIAGADFFIMSPQDAPSYEEYAQYLTDAEMNAIFRKVAGHKAIAD